MSRQLKFRIWDNQSKRFVSNGVGTHCASRWLIDAETGRPVDFVVSLEDHEFGSLNEGENYYIDGTKVVKGPRYAICQFTGKKDKAAREIYEGDIVKLKVHQDFGDRYGQYLFLEVYYHDESASFRLSRDKTLGYYRSFTDLESGRIEVVGNIFESQELLERGPVDLHVYSIYLDSDGSVYCYDKDGKDVEYPKHWPEEIENVREFARQEGVKFIEG